MGQRDRTGVRGTWPGLRRLFPHAASIRFSQLRPGEAPWLPLGDKRETEAQSAEEPGGCRRAVGGGAELQRTLCGSRLWDRSGGRASVQAAAAPLRPPNPHPGGGFTPTEAHKGRGTPMPGKASARTPSRFTDLETEARKWWGWEAHAAILPGGAESASLESSRAGAPPTAAPLGATRRAAQLDNQRGFGKGAWARAPPSRCHRAGGGCDHSCPEIPLSIPLAGPRLTPQTHRHSFLEARRDSEPPEGASVWAQGSFVNSPLPADPTSRPSPAPQQAPRSMGSGG